MSSGLESDLRPNVAAIAYHDRTVPVAGEIFANPAIGSDVQLSAYEQGANDLGPFADVIPSHTQEAIFHLEGFCPS